jgi:hypothetical protein
MAISDTQKVDLLYKKIAWSVTKTDTNPPKEAYNETNPSPLLIRGDSLWQQSGDIPASIPAASSSIVEVYKDGVGSWSSTVQCTEDTGVTDNRTWMTGISDWIGPEFGATYFVKVYIDSTGSTTPQTTGISLQAAGLNDDQWYFDYQSGILNFIGSNLPTAIASGVTGKNIFISGARYAGLKGVNTWGNVTFGNVTVSGNISGNLIGTILTSSQPYITSLGTLTSLNVTGNLVVGNVSLDNITSGNLVANSANISGNVTAQWFIGNVDGSIGNFITSVSSASVAAANSYINNTSVQLQDISIIGNTIRSTGTELIISANTTNPNNLIKFDSISAFVIPTGTDAQRPPNPTYGYVRYNTGKGSIEWWSGSEWTSAIATITGETIYPNGTDVTYTLGQASTDISILVNINGTVQQPTTAYTVVGDQITFPEPPLVTDIIEIRYLAASTALVPSDWNGGDVSGIVNIQSTTQSVSTATGALRVAGGAGILGNLYIGGNLFLAGTNVLAYISSDTTSTVAISANLGAYQTYANANAATQATSINTVNANIGAYQTYANTKIGTNSNSNLVVVSSAQSTSTTTGALVISGGTGIAGNLYVGGNISQQGAYYETYGNVSNTGGNLTCNFNLGSVFYSTLTANVTANFTNVNAIANTVTGATIIVDQGATAYRVANVQINGVNQTVKWVGATVGAGTASNTDIMSFSLIYLGGTTYRVLGQISNYG